MIKKIFDWTPRDLAYWERIRQRGLPNFIVRFGVIASGGLLFVVFGLITLINWLKGLNGVSINLYRIVFLLVQLAFVALVALVAGVINSLITWVVEEKLYRKYKASK